MRGVSSTSQDAGELVLIIDLELENRDFQFYITAVHVSHLCHYLSIQTAFQNDSYAQSSKFHFYIDQWQ